MKFDGFDAVEVEANGIVEKLSLPPIDSILATPSEKNSFNAGL